MTYEILESGKISFYVHPQHEHAFTGPEEVDHFYVIQQPENQEKARLIEIGIKKLPEVMEKSKASTALHWWGLIQQVNTFNEVWVYLNDLRGRVTDVASGTYYFTNHKQHIDFIFLTRVRQPDIANHLGLKERNLFLLAVLNPSKEVPQGFPKKEFSPAYPDTVSQLFSGNRFLTKNFQLELLNYEQTAFVLVAPQRRLVKAELNLLIDETSEQVELDSFAA